MAVNKPIYVELAYARGNKQCLMSLQVAAGTTIEALIHHSGILKLFPEINLQKDKVGIFSKPAQLTDVVNPFDRVEIYRPLKINPKEARRLKARKKN